MNREPEADFDQERLEFAARWDPVREWMDIGFHGAPRRTP